MPATSSSREKEVRQKLAKPVAPGLGVGQLRGWQVGAPPSYHLHRRCRRVGPPQWSRAVAKDTRPRSGSGRARIFAPASAGANTAMSALPGFAEGIIVCFGMVAKFSELLGGRCG